MNPKNQQIFVEGPLPGLNEIIAAAKQGKGRSNGYSRLKRKWTGHLTQIFKTELRPVKSAYIYFTWLETNKRRDPDNISSGGRKLLLDALVHAKIIQDDNWNNINGWEDIFTQAHKPGVIMQIVGVKRRA